MAQLIVRNLDEAVARALRAEAAREKISVEEAHRRVLRRALLPETGVRKLSFKDFLAQMPLDEKYDHIFEREKGSERPPVDFSE